MVPVTASAAPGTRRTAASASPGRISVFDGMQPKNVHSPPANRSSTMAAVNPLSTARPAAFSPGGPDPITITSNSSAIPFLLLGVQRAVARDQVRHQPGPPGLMRGSQARAGISVEILVEQDQVMPHGIG